jgi:hypothetical protein
MFSSSEPIKAEIKTHMKTSEIESAISAYARYAIKSASSLAEARAAIRAASAVYDHAMPLAWRGDLRHSAALAARVARDNARTALSFAYDSASAFGGEGRIEYAQRLEQDANGLMAN